MKILLSGMTRDVLIIEVNLGQFNNRHLFGMSVYAWVPVVCLSVCVRECVHDNVKGYH